MVTIQNEQLTVEIAERGAELQRITGRRGEYLWNGDPAWWSGRAPLLFPIVGKVPEDTYTFGGRAYPMPKHGFAQTATFTVERATAAEAVFLLTDSEETRRSYPFAFQLRVTYRLEGATLSVTHTVSNTGAGPLFMSIGAHEAYACPEGIEQYQLEFPAPCTLDTLLVEHSFITENTRRVVENEAVYSLKNSDFEIDALVFRRPPFEQLTLRHRQTGKGVRVNIADAPYLLVWTKPGAPFLCIEPWWGIAHLAGGSVDLPTKAGMNRLEAGEQFERVHTITVL